ncbi:MAG: histidine phosphatase family protein [Polyangia bacterium]
MASGIELWLVRHGQTESNADGRLSGWSDVDLTAEGRTQARALRSRLAGNSFDGVWSSDLRRAVATARLAFGEPRPDRRLREICFGELENRRWAEIEESYRRDLDEFTRFHAPGGEDLNTFRERLLAFVAELDPGRHLAFTHGGVIRSLTAGLGEDRFLGNGGLIVVDWKNRRLLEVFEPYPFG